MADSKAAVHGAALAFAMAQEAWPLSLRIRLCRLFLLAFGVPLALYTTALGLLLLGGLLCPPAPERQRAASQAPLTAIRLRCPGALLHCLGRVAVPLHDYILCRAYGGWRVRSFLLFFAGRIRNIASAGCAVAGRD